MRELEQAARRLLLTQRYAGDHRAAEPDWVGKLQAGKLDADAVLAGYCHMLYDRHGTIEEVARRTNLDRRTVKAYLQKHEK